MPAWARRIDAWLSPAPSETPRGWMASRVMSVLAGLARPRRRDGLLLSGTLEAWGLRGD